MSENCASYELKDGVLYICPFGDIDHDKTVKLRECSDSFIERGKPYLIVFDLERVDFVDSAGIGFIMGRYRTCGRKCGLKAVNVSPYVARIFKYAGLHQIMDIQVRRDKNE